jgi:hypothetical protein
VPTAAVNDFSPIAARLVVGTALLSLLAAFYLMLSPGSAAVGSKVAADGYSRSALGHLGLIRWLRDNGEAVMQVRGKLTERQASLLVLAEPREVQRDDDDQVEAWLKQTRAMLVVLPKRQGEVDPERPEWAGDVRLVARGAVDKVLAAVGRWTGSAMPEVVRVDAVADWRKPTALPVPEFGSPIQLMAHHPRVNAWVECEQGVLLGRVRDVWVLSDPDLIANHGLHRGDNAEFVWQVLELAKSRNRDGAIVFDETLHGHRLEPSLWLLAGQFPFVLIPVHLLLLTATVLWIAHRRFGRPRAEVAGMRQGKALLIDNTTALLQATGGLADARRRWCRLRLRTVADTLRAPRGLSDAETEAWLLERCADPERRGALARALRHAVDPRWSGDTTALRQLHSLTTEMMHVRR